MGLDGKSVLVTGAGSGIGRSTAVLLAGAGSHVTLVDLDRDGCAETLALITQSGGQAHTVTADISKEEDVVRAVRQAVEKFGKLNGACNVAGIRPTTKFIQDLSLEEWNRHLAINLTGGFLCVKHTAAAILEGGNGSIVLVASAAALKGFPGASEYCAAKSGLLGLMRSASCEYASRGVRVNAILPGSTRTPMFEASMQQHKGIEEVLRATHPIGRFGEPDEIGFAIRWLISDESSFVTGAAIPVDGGNTSV